MDAVLCVWLERLDFYTILVPRIYAPASTLPLVMHVRVPIDQV